MGLRASDRIKVIREIARLLAPEEWSLIDLTLRQFYLPATDQWQGEKGDYVVEMISDAKDDTLIELASHLGYELERERSAIEPSFWRTGYFRLFLSHLASNKEKATRLQLELLKFHISAFVAHKDIQPVKEWEEEIIVALSTCDALLALLDTGFHKSEWTDQEIGFAMGKDNLVITVSLGETPYGFMGRFQAIDGKSKSEAELAEEICNILTEHKQTAKRMAYALLGKFETSDTFQDAKNNMRLLEKVTYWDQTLTHRIKSAKDNNDQIEKAYGVPERINALIQQWS